MFACMARVQILFNYCTHDIALYSSSPLQGWNPALCNCIKVSLVGATILKISPSNESRIDC